MYDQNSNNKEESWKDSDFLCFDNDNDDDNNDDDDDDEYKNDNNNGNNNGNDNNNDVVEQEQPQSKRRKLNHHELTTTITNNNNNNKTYNNNKRLPPWMDKSHETNFNYYFSNTPKLILLHEEIVQFVNLMKPQQIELEVRNEFIDKVKTFILNLFGNHVDKDNMNNNNDKNNNDNDNKSDKCQVHVFGSQATGLLLPTSDIDFVVMLPDYDIGNNTTNNNNNNKDNNNNNNNKEMKSTNLTKEEEIKEMAEYDIHKHSSFHSNYISPLVRLAKELRTQWKDELTYLEVVENTKVPIVKFTHGPTNLSADICFNQENGIQAAELMKRFMDAMPPLRPLTFVLKYFMAARGLNEPYSGGCGSFMIQMMIVSFLQHRERYDYNKQQQQHHYYNSRRGRDEYRTAPMNLGSLLIEFFELYGMDFNYLTTALSVRHDGFYFPKGHHQRREHFFTTPTRSFTLGIENPFDITMDVGKPSFRMSLIQKSFEVALRVLLSHVSHPAVPTDSILESIIPPTEEMYKRATMNKVLRIDEQLNSQGYNVDNRTNSTKKKILSDVSHPADHTDSILESVKPPTEEINKGPTINTAGKEKAFEFKLDWRSGCVISVKGLPDDCDREAILSAVEAFMGEKVSVHADYSRGAKDGAIRFNEPNENIRPLANELNEGNVTINNKKVGSAFVLEGEEEKKYYDDYIAHRTKIKQERGKKKRKAEEVRHESKKRLADPAEDIDESKKHPPAVHTDSILESVIPPTEEDSKKRLEDLISANDLEGLQSLSDELYGITGQRAIRQRIKKAVKRMKEEQNAQKIIVAQQNSSMETSHDSD